MRFSLGEFVLDRSTRQLLCAGVERHLEPKAFELLDLLLDRRPNVVSKTDIQECLWPHSFVAESSLTGLVAQVRQALGDDPRRPRFVRTIHGTGYAFSGEASLEPPEAPAAPRMPDTDGLTRLDSVAVLPFVDLSPQQDQEYFCDGLAEELLNALTRIRGLRVASRTSAFQFKGTSTDVREIGRRLGVRAVLEGSVRKAGEQLRITIQLTDVENGFSLSSESYDRALPDVFEVQEGLAALVVNALEVRLTDDERRGLETAPTTDLRAYDSYLRGQALLHELRVDEVTRAREMFRSAVAADPAFALAHGALATASWFLYSVNGQLPEDLAVALSASAKAVALRPDLAEAHAARGAALTLAQDNDGAEAEYRTAIDLNPRLFEAYYSYARMCLLKGRFADAAPLFERATSLRPDDYSSPTLLALVYASLGEHDKARKFSAQGVAASTRHLARNPADTRAVCETGRNLICLGQIDRGLEWIERARRMDPHDGPTLYHVACAYAVVGRPAEALDILEQCLDAGFGNLDWISNDPDWAGVQDDPRFQALLDRMR